MHPIVSQLHFARREFVRCLDGLSPEDAVRRLGPTNCISWMVGHLASQENFLWCVMAQEQNAAPALYELVGFGRPATTPPLDEMWRTWQKVTATADAYLQTIDDQTLQTFITLEGKAHRENVGASLLRNIYHYWFHIGEAHGVRQQLGHGELPQFVGDMRDVMVR